MRDRDRHRVRVTYTTYRGIGVLPPYMLLVTENWLCYTPVRVYAIGTNGKHAGYLQESCRNCAGYLPESYRGNASFTGTENAKREGPAQFSVWNQIL
jgi:hypothetical protein